MTNSRITIPAIKPPRGEDFWGSFVPAAVENKNKKILKKWSIQTWLIEWKGYEAQRSPLLYIFVDTNLISLTNLTRRINFRSSVATEGKDKHGLKL